MELDYKHKNIGATVQLHKELLKLTGDTLSMVSEFGEESLSCDYRRVDCCSIAASMSPCGVGNCPLGDMVEGELKEIADQIENLNCH